MAAGLPMRLLPGLAQRTNVAIVYSGAQGTNPTITKSISFPGLMRLDGLGYRGTTAAAKERPVIFLPTIVALNEMKVRQDGMQSDARSNYAHEWGDEVYLSPGYNDSTARTFYGYWLKAPTEMVDEGNPFPLDDFLLPIVCLHAAGLLLLSKNQGEKGGTFLQFANGVVAQFAANWKAIPPMPFLTIPATEMAQAQMAAQAAGGGK
jgi:hypothetical protein